LFQQDAELFNLHELVELILAQPGLGSTVKTDGEESDPLAILTMLNMHVHQVCLSTTLSRRWEKLSKRTESPFNKSTCPIPTQKIGGRQRVSYYTSGVVVPISESRRCRAVRKASQHACASHTADVSDGYRRTEVRHR
jgi:hypothetical protein